MLLIERKPSIIVSGLRSWVDEARGKSLKGHRWELVGVIVLPLLAFSGVAVARDTEGRSSSKKVVVIADARASYQREGARGRAPRPDAETPEAAARLNDQAWRYYSQGRYVKAESLHKRALAITEKALGPEHPTVALVLKNYATLLRNVHRGAEADKLETRVKEIREKARPK